MCGICGWAGQGPDPERLAAMAGTILHRGPDEGGFHHGRDASLAIRRLSIIDVSHGHQPYRNETDEVAVVFNGEIYNFQELRRELEIRGHRFNSHADGEVIAHLYEERGAECVQALNGMFAFALWDERRRRLLLARDRMGEKPLYYRHQGDTLYFGSELKTMLALPGLPRVLDLEALNQYLTFEYVPAPRTILEGYRKLPPAHRLVFEKGQVRVEPYWRLELSPQPVADEAEWVEEFRHRLKESVRLRLVSDVPLGVFLSGGIDSSSLAALMSELHPGGVKTFSVGFKERSYDESRHFRKVARHLGTDHHEEILAPRGTADLLEPLLEVLDEPLGDAAIVPTYLLSRFARRHVTVALSGEGADELLGGYPTYLAHRLAQGFSRLPRPLLSLFRWLAVRLPVSTRYISFDYKLKRFFGHLQQEPVSRHFSWMGSFSAVRTQPLLQGSISAGVMEPVHPHRLRLEALPLLERIQHLDLHFYLPDDLLVKLDRATMAVSLEGRAPFLDHTLVEFLARVPSDLKLRGTEPKRLLRKAMAGSLPSSVLHRAKKGFGIPVADWVKGDLRPLVQDYLDPVRLDREGIFRPGPIRTVLDYHFSGRADMRKQIWTLLIFQMWKERYRPDYPV